jgi:hypothetical protein
VNLGRLHVRHYLLHGLQHLCLHDEYFLQHRWAWGVALVVVIVGIGVYVIVPGAGHLKCRGVHES